MKADRESFAPATWSISARRSDEIVMDVFSFIPPSFHLFILGGKSHMLGSRMREQIDSVRR